MNVLFLDHQGVMYLKKHNYPGKLDYFDLECIESLNYIIDKTDCEIVISSDWKYWVKLDEMKRFYSDQHILKSPISYTDALGYYDAKGRSIEILNWVNNNKVDNWISIDDLDMRGYLSKFVWVNSCNGIVDYYDDIIKQFHSSLI